MKELSVDYYLNASFPRRGLRVTFDPRCSEPHSANDFVQGLFGVKKIQNKECTYLQSVTMSFADSYEVFIETDLALELTDYHYCATAILNGNETTIVDGR